jgi:hypothetical protein
MTMKLNLAIGLSEARAIPPQETASLVVATWGNRR